MATLRVHNGAWVVIGDGKKSLVLHNDGDADILNLRRVSVQEDSNPASRDQGSDAPGRGFAGAGSRRSAMGETDWHQIEEDRFAAHLAADLNKASQTQAFNELIVVAPPKVLGELRKEFSAETRKRVVAEIHKDLTHHTLPDIEKALARYDID